MKSLYALCLITVISLLSAPGFAAVNVGQVTGDRTSVGCNFGFTYADIPDLQLSLQTKGDPVQVSFVVSVQLGAFSGVSLRPTLDGAPPDESVASTDGVEFLNGGASGMVVTLTFQRVYATSKGQHVFGVQMNCQESASARFRWLTVMELHE
jgi:hypothetical protein